MLARTAVDVWSAKAEGLGALILASNITEALIARGDEPADIDKIWGGNFLRVLKSVSG